MNGGVPRSSSGVYDVTNQADVLALLKLVRTSTLDPESKDEVRDLLFALDGGNAQQTVGALSVHLDPLSVTVSAGDRVSTQADVETPVSTATSVPDTTVVTASSHRAGFAGGRPLPSFGPATRENSATVTTVSSSKPDVTPSTEPVSSAPFAPEAKPEPDASAASDVAVTASTIEPMERIKEIKKIINDQVGNPAHLIDTTNDIGRAYMNALLTAMKAVSGEGDTAAAMTELEIAFEAVQKSLAAHQAAEPTESASVVEPNTEDKDSAPDVVPAPFVATPHAAPAEPDLTSTPENIPTAPVKSATPTAPADEPVESITAAPVADAVATPSQAESATKTTAVPTPQPAAKPQSGLRSLADTMQRQDEAKTAAQPATPVVTTPQDPLESDMVENGLDQLLKEWSLFKSSGLLGTGAKGAAHPLYKELRNMPMNMVIAGRFEGATPEVRQSITDYMNGWRYEQGMTHDMQETFEHYLRRVVKTIIDKQAK